MGLTLEKGSKFDFKIIGESFDTRVVEFTLQDSLSTPYQADLVLACEDSIDLDKAIGKEGLLSIDGEKGERTVHGIINQFSQSGTRGRFFVYSATLVPQFWLLSQKQ